MHGCCSFSTETAGNPHLKLPRQLAHPGPVGGQASISQIRAPQLLRVPGTQGKFYQERLSVIESRMRDVVTLEHALAIQQLAASFKIKDPSPLKTFQWMLGLMASAFSVLQLGLASHAASSVVPPYAWCHRRLRIKVSQACIAALEPLEGPSVNGTGRAPGNGLQMEGYLYINCLKILSVWLGIRTFLPDLRGHHVLFCSDSMTVVSYIKRQGGLFSRRLFTLAECLLSWGQVNLHMQDKLNMGADMLSRSNVPSDEWTLHPQTVQVIWGIFRNMGL